MYLAYNIFVATKKITIEHIGDITLVKTTASRSLRLTVNTRGDVRVSLPYWTPYAVAEAFARSHIRWIQEEISGHKATRRYVQGQKIGKLHHLLFEKISEDKSLSSRVTTTKIIVKLYSNEDAMSKDVQLRAEKAIYRALRKEAEQLLPPRVNNIAEKYGFSFRSISAKQLKRRWGSCDNRHNLVFNFFLMELPWEYIDYVIMHELTHTEHLHHGPAFWERLKQICPAALDIKHQMKEYRPIIGG